MTEHLDTYARSKVREQLSCELRHIDMWASVSLPKWSTYLSKQQLSLVSDRLAGPLGTSSCTF